MRFATASKVVLQATGLLAVICSLQLGCLGDVDLGPDHRPDSMVYPPQDGMPQIPLNDSGSPTCSPGSAQACTVPGAMGPCAVGQQTCDPSGNWGACTAPASQSPEICSNNPDDDCNGQVNNGCTCTPNTMQACTVPGAMGPCAIGQQTCDPSGNWGACTAPAPLPQEICSNNIDDDCNGKVDDGCDSQDDLDDCECSFKLYKLKEFSENRDPTKGGYYETKHLCVSDNFDDAGNFWSITGQKAINECPLAGETQPYRCTGWVGIAEYTDNGKCGL